VAIHDGDDLVVVNIAKPLSEVHFAQEPNVGEQLAKPNIRR
jgi:hypothetical protein